MGRGDLSDAEWERLRPFLPVGNRRCGRWRDHRQVIDGILHRVRIGVQWRDLPERFGPWKTVYKRHRLWSADGTWEHLLQQVQAAAEAAGEIDWNISVDSTIVRAHQHAAGARRTRPRRHRGPNRQNTRTKSAVAESPRPAGGGGAGGEGLGRSRGGFTTKLHLSADGRCRPLSLIVTSGQRADCTQFKPVLENIRVPRTGPGRPRRKPDSLAADKAYSNGPCREYLRRRGIRHTIPEMTDSQAARLRKGSRGGRPPGFDEEPYKKRNTIERAINRLKQHRAVASRYDKRRYVYLGTATAAALTIWLRT
ncbi:IS5 family transposase [Streptomyces sp. NPDC057445]|uniref:IS5 family transposase n=1 Tax=Streptomyces sp. NPDC057445 TaxID=3346136 RepID=UPI003699D302